MIIPLKLKYLTAKPRGNASKGSSGVVKKKTIWKHLQENARKRGK